MSSTAVFVRHRITAPEFDWDDYRCIDVKGEVVILFTNELPSEALKSFGGKALTYYGRWTRTKLSAPRTPSFVRSMAPSSNAT